MTEQVLMNDEAARSSTGEILDQQTPATTTETKPTASETPVTQTDTTSQDKPTPSETKPEAKPAAAPDKYEFKAHDGYTLDEKLIDTITPIFKEAGLTQDAAQKLVDFHAKQMLDAAKGPQDAYAATRTEWQAKVKADPDMAKATNGNATGLDAVKLDIGRALNSINDAPLVAEFKQAMDITGAGDHPAVVKALWKLAQHITEGKHVTGAGPSAAGQKSPDAKPASIAHALYPNLK